MHSMAAEGLVEKRGLRGKIRAKTCDTGGNSYFKEPGKKRDHHFLDFYDNTSTGRSYRTIRCPETEIDARNALPVEF